MHINGLQRLKLTPQESEVSLQHSSPMPAFILVTMWFDSHILLLTKFCIFIVTCDNNYSDITITIFTRQIKWSSNIKRHIMEILKQSTSVVLKYITWLSLVIFNNCSLTSPLWDYLRCSMLCLRDGAAASSERQTARCFSPGFIPLSPASRRRKRELVWKSFSYTLTLSDSPCLGTIRTADYWGW